MEVSAKILPECKKGKEEKSAAPLCTTLKDHNNNFLQEKVDLSFSYGLKTLQDQLMEEPLEDSLRGSERVVRLEVISNAFCSVLRDKGVPALVRAGLKVDVFGIENSHLPDGNQCITKALASPIVKAMNDVERAMENLVIRSTKEKFTRKFNLLNIHSNTVAQLRSFYRCSAPVNASRKPL